jgi:hypothetical protein
MRLIVPTEPAPRGDPGGLSSWRDGPAKQAIAEFVARACADSGSKQRIEPSSSWRRTQAVWEDAFASA